MAGQGAVYIGIQGTVLALDRATGHILWTHRLKGLGLGIVTIAGSNQSAQSSAELLRRQAEAAPAAS